MCLPLKVGALLWFCNAKPVRDGNGAQKGHVLCFVSVIPIIYNEGPSIFVDLI